ncbi:hypothetical protein FOYG_12949 [Fusarium oxysporum NRRL 32931]|uniref:Alcohol dehydrogenase-like C-terminal domain-containing protein n=1 Tax=Fusarium oxysporum NRRL 32931 TaxID=660029 RepID=W9HXW1_FUSOX|nr:hypothetical protein FOYG_12949 [Fusarium oxysporum NRRL 32931]
MARKVRLIGIARASQHAFLRQTPYAYDDLFDYKDSSWVDAVINATGGRGVQYALDCISEGETIGKFHATFAKYVRGDGHFAVFRGPSGGRYRADGLRVNPMYGAVWEGLGVEVEYNGSTMPANPAARAFAAAFFDYLSSNEWPKLQPNPIRLMPGGLERVVPDGFELLGKDQVSARSASHGRSEDWMRPISGEKLVYALEV